VVKILELCYFSPGNNLNALALVPTEGEWTEDGGVGYTFCIP
jgi:hypothetical protein